MIPFGLTSVDALIAKLLAAHARLKALMSAEDALALRRIQDLLREIRVATHRELPTALSEVFERAHAKSSGTLPTPVSPDPSVMAQAQARILTDLDKALTSISVTSRRQSSKPGTIQIVGRSGRSTIFDLDYYANLVLSSNMARLETDVTLSNVFRAGEDLVMVSANPSSIGDYCDAYRGRTFSISGTHDVFPPLSSTPNGGPPFHPWCRHSISYFPGPEAIGQVADPAFLLKPDETSPGRIHEEWEKRRAG